MIQREPWYREAAGEAELFALLRKLEQGEDVSGEIKSLARRLGYPSIVPHGFYVDWWREANEAAGNPEFQADLPVEVRAVYPDFNRDLWDRVNNWDPRQLKTFFENDRHLQGAKEMAWDEPEDFEVQQGYRRGFFDATDFVIDQLAPAFDSALDQIKRRGYASQHTLDRLFSVLGEYLAQDRAGGESHQQIIEGQMWAAQVQSERLYLLNMANRLSHEYGPALALWEEYQEEIPQGADLKKWLDEVWTTTNRFTDRYRMPSGPDIVRLKEMDKEWTEKWEPLLEAFEEEQGINRYDYYEEPGW